MRTKNDAVAKKRVPLFKRVWFWIIIVLVLTISGLALSMPFSYSVANIAIKVACSGKNNPKPANYDAICDGITEQLDLKYASSYGNNTFDLYYPKGNTAPLPVVVYFHGGYYVGGNKEGSAPYCKAIAVKGYIVASFNYELAPKNKFPGILYQANEGIAHLLANAQKYNIDVNKVIIGGDSAGGHLTGILGAYYTNEIYAKEVGGTPSLTASQLKGVLLLCGFFNIYTVRETKFPLLNEAMWMFTGVKKYETAKTASQLNTINNVTADYPATYITCGDKDPFYSQNQEMSEKLKDLGVSTTAYLPVSADKKLKHEFQRDFNLKECNQAMDILLNFLKEQCA